MSKVKTSSSLSPTAPRGAHTKNGDWCGWRWPLPRPFMIHAFRTDGSWWSFTLPTPLTLVATDQINDFGCSITLRATFSLLPALPKLIWCARPTLQSSMPSPKASFRSVNGSTSHTRTHLCTVPSSFHRSMAAGLEIVSRRKIGRPSLNGRACFRTSLPGLTSHLTPSMLTVGSILRSAAPRSASSWPGVHAALRATRDKLPK